jgi:hypothetical protein
VLQTKRRFDAYLGTVQSSDLKSMVRLWGGRSQMRKDECIALISAALDDPARVQAALTSLTPYERTALALVKQMGGTIDAGALSVALRTTGVALPTTRQPYSEDTTTLLQPLIRRGLLLSTYSSDPSSLGYAYGGSAVVFSDERLLAGIGPMEYVTLSLTAAPPPAAATYRRPPSVILDIVGVLQAIDTLGGIQLTKAGPVRTSDVRKLARAMGWNESEIVVDGLAFPSPALAWINALRHAGLLSIQSDALHLSTPIDQFARHSYAEQIGPLLHGFIAAHEWSEWQTQTTSWYENHRAWGRLALSVALAALPTTSEDFYAVDDLDQALFDRIGEHFSLGYLPRRPYTFNKTPDEVRREELAWRAKLRSDWLASERPWLALALSSWLYYLGIVELGLESGKPVSLRLTDLGRAALRPDLAPAAEAPPMSQAAWLVQPNFDVMVYLERVTPEQLVFLERHAERVGAHQHTAQYRLTRDSVYHGLESGTSPDDLLATLQSGAGMEVPQNVLVELRDWAASREQIRLRRRARLLEYANAQAREAALAGGLAGMPVGDRFVLLNGGALPRPEITIRVDYTGSLPACLSVAGDGVIMIAKPTADLVIEPQLDRWAERIADHIWRLTAASVGASVKAGVSIGALFKLLDERLIHPLPLLLGVALRAWAGQVPRAELATVSVLRCRESAVFEAITHSEKLQPYIRGTLAPDVLLVDTQNVKALREELTWAGVAVADVLQESGKRR